MPGVAPVVSYAMTPSAPPVAPSSNDTSSMDDDWSRPSSGLVITPSVLAERDALLAGLEDKAKSQEAADKLRARQWLKGPPPASFVKALTHVDVDAESLVFDIARAWERAPMSHAVVDHMKESKDKPVREHDAWLLQHLGASSDWLAICDVAIDYEEAVPTRRWLIKALERFAIARSLGWKELMDPLSSLALDANPTIRDSATGVAAVLPKGEEKRRLLLEILRGDDDETVLSHAIAALATTLPVEIGTALAERLLAHPSERVQSAVKELVTHARAVRNSMVPPKASMPPSKSS
jgi:hypothetical protein